MFLKDTHTVCEILIETPALSPAPNPNCHHQMLQGKVPRPPVTTKTQPKAEEQFLLPCLSAGLLDQHTCQESSAGWKSPQTLWMWSQTPGVCVPCPAAASRSEPSPPSLPSCFTLITGEQKAKFPLLSFQLLLVAEQTPPPLNSWHVAG